MNDQLNEQASSSSSLKILGGALFIAFLGFLVGYAFRGDSTMVPLIKQAKSEYQKPGAPVAYQKPSKQRFVRLRRDAQKNAEFLDVAAASYVPSNGSNLEVTLIGAVHVADPEYFAKLNEEFKKYDVVLYELVAEKGTRPDAAAARNGGAFGNFQLMLPDMLGLSHQLEKTDYTAPNLVHADLSMEELMEEGKRRGETGFTLAAGIALDFVRLMQKIEQADGTQAQATQSLAGALSNPKLLKQTFAENLAMEDPSEGIVGFTTLTPYLIDIRNEAALKVLDENIAAGKKKIAIFYGAAHLPDFEERLFRDYGLRRESAQWFEAWDLKRAVPETSPINKLTDLFKLFGNK